jgi:hypothetical protein
MLIEASVATSIFWASAGIARIIGSGMRIIETWGDCDGTPNDSCGKKSLRQKVIAARIADLSVSQYRDR